MPIFTERSHAVVAAACERLIPPTERHPGAQALGVADYIDTLLGAFAFDPPRIWAGGPFSGRHGGAASFARSGPLARRGVGWRTRIEGSLGLPEREFNGPVVGLQDLYRDGVAALGADFADLSPDGRTPARRRPAFKQLLYEHALRGRVRRARCTAATATWPAGRRSGSPATSSPAATPTSR